MLNKQVYAFWRYSHFPFVCGGTVVGMSESGCVETKEYGKGYWFLPLRIMPLEAGKALHEKINNLDAEYDSAKKAVHATYEKKLKEITPW